MKEVKIEIPQGYGVDKENSTFEKIVFKKVKEVNSLEDAIAYLGEEDSTVRQLRLLNSLHRVSDKIVSEIEIEVVSKALNQNWTPNWKDSNEAKWLIWWDMEKDCFGYVYDYYRGTVTSSRLCFKSKELALKAVEILSKQLSNYYKY